VQGLSRKVPAPILAKLTVPLGTLFVPMSVSVTVAVQVVEVPTIPGTGAQLIDTEIVRLFAASAKPLLPDPR
jgi:hypothetical protein